MWIVLLLPLQVTEGAGSREWVACRQADRQAGGCMPLAPSEINAHTYSKERNLWQQMATAVAASMQRHCHKEQKQLRQKFQSITVTITMSPQGIQ